MNGYWVVTRWGRWGALLVESVREGRGKRDWGPEQAAGPPDTLGSGDIRTAWASRTPDGQTEWLLLEYAAPARPKRVEVYQTYNPGALVKVSAFTPENQETVIWKGQDPTPAGTARGVSPIPVDVNFETRSVKLYIDSPAVQGWNEIDAVGLVDVNERVHWAVAVRASSTYATRSDASGSPQDLIPWWSELAEPTESFASGSAEREHRAAAAYGWPFISMSAEYTLPPSASPFAPQPWFPGVVFTTAQSGSRGTSAVLPHRPIWTGFLLDSVAYAIVLWLGRLGVSKPVRVLKEVMRIRCGQCPACGYNLRYDFARGCPECGWLRGQAGNR